MVNIHTVGVNRSSQLEVGAYYLIKGTRHGFPLPPQVFYLEKKDIHPMISGVGHLKGVMFWRMWNTIGVEEDHLLTLHEVNIPEHGDHDVHLERIDEQTVRRAVNKSDYKDVQDEIATRLRSMLG